ncbi:CHAT domain-containing tetratricopeptide repeat protein [Parapedobacter koreensis]|uniref:Tetratricopeptide repeat-containing protein n=1 Tax=Parapedobacter koreensis TaxID=332977 RepID=A0A1H7EXJ0_9SPHI|nr:CHAT domain-containing protein [Parapedobacter koreensis]SEK17817.1 Tetratricopeptide repeat-containing protein [Parapedobacter koreensis]
MKLTLLSVCLISCFAFSAPRQENDYEKATRTYRENKLDSAAYYIGNALHRYRATDQRDSLVFAYVQQALITWSQHGLEEALRLTDTAVAIAEQLPRSHAAVVAAYGRMGQLLTQQYAFEAAARYFSKAEAVMDAKRAPSRHDVLLYNYIAIRHLMLEGYEPAKQYAQRAYTLNLQLEGINGWDMPSILQTRYFISRYSEDYEQALVDGLAFQQAIQRLYPPDHPNVGTMHNSLAIIYETLRRYEEALYHRQQAVNIQFNNYLHVDNSFSLAAAYQNLGNLYGYINEPFLAQEYLGKGSRLLMQTYGEDGLGMVKVLVDLAVNKSRIGQYDEAEKRFQQAYALQKQHAPDDQMGMAYVENFFGDLYFDQQRYEAAADWYTRALERYKRANAMHLELALLIQRNLAVIMAATGQQQAAIAMQRSVLASFRKLYPPGNDAIADKLHHLSMLYLQMGQTEQALAFSDSVFAELTLHTPLPLNVADWFHHLPFSYATMVYIQQRTQILYQLASQSSERHRLDEVLALTDQYTRFVSDNLHAFRTQAALIDLAAINKKIYSVAIEVSWELANGDQSYLERAFAYAERSKALLMRLAANGMLVDAQQTEKDIVARRDHDFRRRINTLNLQYLNSRRDDSLLTLLSATMEGYRVFQDSLKKTRNDLFWAKHALEPPSLADIRNTLLTNKETLVAYAVTEQAILIFVLTPQTFRALRIGREVLDDAKSLRELHGLTAAAFVAPAHRLYQALIKPVEPYFTSNRLLIVPDAELYLLNFEVLLADQQEKRFSRMPYLIHTYDLSYLLSAASAVQFKAAHRAKTKERALLFTPVFTDEMKAMYRKNLKQHGLEDSDYLYLYRQPFALQAARQIGSVVAHDLYAEQDAQEQVFKQVAPDYRILHLGTHAELNDEAPLLSRLFLAKASPGDTLNREDGYLHAYEIYAMQLRAELAVLTACETGAGAWRNGEGVISLAHSFMHAGCPSVVMSLWKIDEKASMDIIARFYDRLAKGDSKSTALRNAKLHLMEKGDERLAHPYYWAGLALIGDNAPVYGSVTTYYWTAGLATAMLLGMVIFVFRRSRNGDK